MCESERTRREEPLERIWLDRGEKWKVNCLSSSSSSSHRFHSFSLPPPFHLLPLFSSWEANFVEFPAMSQFPSRVATDWLTDWLTVPPPVHRTDKSRAAVARCGQVWPGVARCGQVWPDVARCGQVWPGVARCGQVWWGVAEVHHLRAFFSRSCTWVHVRIEDMMPKKKIHP